LTLERQKEGGWQPVASTWFNDLPDDRWAWVTADRWLEPGRYRLRETEGQASVFRPATVGPERMPAVRCLAERTHLTVRVSDSSPRRDFLLEGDHRRVGPAPVMEMVLEPGCRVRLYGRDTHPTDPPTRPATARSDG